MAAALAITPSSGVKATKTVCRINVTGAALNDENGYDNTKYPTEPAIEYVLFLDAPAGTDDKLSHVFSPSADGKYEFNNFIFDTVGTWNVRLRKKGSTSNVASLSVSVS